MNDRFVQLNEIVEKMPQLGMSVPDSVVEALHDLENPKYRIALVGRFQTGKSHLVNQAFLNQTLLLREGIGLCTTAVTTEVAYGDAPRLVVDYKGNEPTKIIESPGAADVSEAVGADDNDKRIELAATVKSVRLEWPCEAMRNLTILDTAGIDDPNPELLRATTYRTIPESDGVVMVVAAKALSTVELDFLKGSIFSCGLSRAMIMVSYRPVTDALSEEGRGKVLETIRGQLAAIGREDIPVRMLCYDTEVTGDILNTTDDIRAAIVQFAEESALGNRIEKITVALKKIVGDHLAELQFQRQIADKDATELADIRARIVALAEQLRQERENLRVRYDASAAAIREDATLTFRAECDGIAKRFCEGFAECEDFAATQARIETAQGELMPQIENAAVQGFETIRLKIGEEVIRCGARLAELCENCKLGSYAVPSGLTVDGGWCGNWNAKLVTIGDYLLTIFLLPGGLFMGWCLRYVWGHLPYVKCIVPSALLAGHVVAKVRESIDGSIKEIGDRFGECAKDALDKLRDDMFKAVTDEIDTLMDKAVCSVEAQERGGLGKDVQTIDEEISGCTQILNEL